MPTRDRAAYMRDYRRSRKVDAVMGSGGEYIGRQTADGIVSLNEKITALEGEVARLKRELAARPALVSRPPITAMREFRPVPKPSQRK